MSKWKYHEIHGKKYGIVDEKRKKILGISTIRRNGVEDIFLDVDREYEDLILLVPEMIAWIERARGLLRRAKTVVNRQVFSEIDEEKARELREFVQDIQEYIWYVWRTE